jgi:environmental stress-induced protein Ves
MFNSIFEDIVTFKDDVEKYDTAGQVTDYNIIRRIHFICLITETVPPHTHTHTHRHTHAQTDRQTHTQTGYEIIIYFPRRKMVNAPQFSVYLPVLVKQ